MDASNSSFEVPEGLQFKREGLSMSQLSSPGINFDSADMEEPFEVPEDLCFDRPPKLAEASIGGLDTFEVPEDLCFERRGLSVCWRRRPSPLNPTLKGW